MSPVKFRGVLFDMDGTLVDSIPQHKKALQRTLERYGVELPPDEWDKHLGYTSLVRAAVPHLSETRVVAIVQEIAECFRDEFLHEVRMFDGAYETIEYTYRSFGRVGIVTSSSKKSTNAVLSHCDIRRFFDVIVCKEQVTQHKPHPEPFLVGAEMYLKLLPESVIAVEDSRQGIHSAVAAGVHTIGIATTHSDHDILLDAGACHTAHDHNELKLLLEILHSLGPEYAR
jgi:HAD superfamily hydrolase (TIGR01509 family)